jgi:hypothetical protein
MHRPWKRAGSIVDATTAAVAKPKLASTRSRSSAHLRVRDLGPAQRTAARDNEKAIATARSAIGSIISTSRAHRRGTIGRLQSVCPSATYTTYDTRCLQDPTCMRRDTRHIVHHAKKIRSVRAACSVQRAACSMQPSIRGSASSRDWNGNVVSCHCCVLPLLPPLYAATAATAACCKRIGRLGACRAARRRRRSD